MFRAWLLALPLVLLLTAPAAADLSVTRVDNGPIVQIIVSGGDGENDQLDFSGGGNFTFDGQGTTTLTASGCTGPNADQVVTCQNGGLDVLLVTMATGTGNDTVKLVGPLASASQTTLNLGTGEDRYIGLTPVGTPLLMDGDDGTDIVDMSQRNTPVVASLSDESGGVQSDGPLVTGDFETLLGGSVNDVLTGGGGVQTINGNGGDDVIQGGAAGDSLTGGPGSDTLSYAPETADITASLLAGSASDGDVVAEFERLAGGKGNDTLTGRDEGDPLIAGGEGNDVLFGGDGVDRLEGGEGDDVLVGGSGTDTMLGGNGTDLASYQERPTAVQASLDEQANDGSGGEADLLESGIEGLRGGGGADTLTGDAGANVLQGGDGDDSIDAGDGADSVEGGAGNDSLNGGGAVDGYAAGAGDDTINSVDGNAEGVDCGDGTDKGTADANDTLTACEAVSGGDKDGDGVLSPADCDDANANIKPGARDTPGNGVDEDCQGGDAPFPRVLSAVRNTWGLAARFSIAQSFLARSVPSGGRVEVRCKPPKKKRKACPFKRRSKAAPRNGGDVNMLSAFKKRRLPVGTVIEVRITAPAMIGRVLRFTIRPRKVPRTTERCLPPGASKPVAC